MPDPRPKLASNWTLAGLLLFTLTIRAAVIWSMRDNLQQDPDAYREIAENLLRHGEFAVGKGDSAAEIRPTAYRPPLYPVLLSNLPAASGQRISLTKVAFIHLLLGVGTVWLTSLAARRLHAMPLLAGILVACDPILLNQQALVMTETLAAFLAVLSLWCLARFDANRSWFNAALAGGAIGLAILCRPTFLPWLALVAIAMWIVRSRNSDHATPQPRRAFDGFGWRFANVAGLLVASAIVIAPWPLRNQKLFDRPIIATTHGGYTLLLGNNYEFYRWLKSSDRSVPWKGNRIDRLLEEKHWFLMNPDKAHMEIHQDQFCYGLARKVIREQPENFVRACAFRVRQLWSPLPYKLTTDESSARRLLRYATCAWYCSVYALAIVGIWRLRWKLLSPPWIWGVLLCLAFTAVHTFYWTNLRMRAPLMPFVAIVAAAGLMVSSSKFRVSS